MYSSPTYDIIGSDNGLAPVRRQASIWNYDVLFSIVISGITFIENLMEIPTILFKKMHFKMSYAKLQPSYLCLNLLM